MNVQTEAACKAQATVMTAHGSRYLQQLCKHWAHKFETTYDPSKGRIQLTIGETRLSAQEDSLVIDLSAADAANLATLKDVVVSHIERFAFRETLQFEWR